MFYVVFPEASICRHQIPVQFPLSRGKYLMVILCVNVMNVRMWCHHTWYAAEGKLTLSENVCLLYPMNYRNSKWSQQNITGSITSQDLETFSGDLHVSSTDVRVLSEITQNPHKVRLIILSGPPDRKLI